MKGYKDVKYRDLETGEVHGGLFERVKDKAKSKANDVKCFYQNNKELCDKVLIPSAICLTAYAGKGIVKARKQRKDALHHDRQVYDRKLDHWCTMKRRPTAKEWNSIARRRANGENYTQILIDMGLLIC